MNQETKETIKLITARLQVKSLANHPEELQRKFAEHLYRTDASFQMFVDAMHALTETK
jgi:hypothetical protein